MICIKDLYFQYKDSDRFALSDISLQIEEGEFVGIIGSSGSGKTTLTHVLNGVVPHYYGGDFYGSAVIGGLDTVTAAPTQLAQMTGSVFQDIDGQMVASVVEDELLFGLENFGLPRAEIEKRIEDALETVGIRELRYRSIFSLSGGQKQKVAIAAIVALRPRLLILDEPTGELDPKSSRMIFDMLLKLNREYGMTVVIVEQKIMLLCEYVKRLLVMDRGSVLFDGEVHEVLRNADELRRVGVNVPRVTTLADILRGRGLYRGPQPASVDEAERMVREVLPHA